MKLRLMALLGAMVGSLVGTASAQVAVEMKTDRASYLKYEPIRVAVTLHNHSGNALIFGTGGNEGRLRFIVEGRNGLELQPREKNVNPAAGLVLGAGEAKMLDLQLNTLYPLEGENHYTIKAQVEHPRLAKNYRGEPRTFDVVAGTDVWTREMGVPTQSDATPIRVKKVALCVFGEKGNDQYALRLEDDDVVFGVVRLGPRIGGAQPQCDVDAGSNIHSLVMIRPRFFEYKIHDNTLHLRQTQYYVTDVNIPSLQRDPDVGRVRVTGGRLAVKGQDYQVPESALQSAPVVGEPGGAGQKTPAPATGVGEVRKSAAMQGGPLPPELPPAKGDKDKKK